MMDLNAAKRSGTSSEFGWTTTSFSPNIVPIPGTNLI
jgi:hypothetical protein